MSLLGSTQESKFEAAGRRVERQTGGYEMMVKRDSFSAQALINAHHALSASGVFERHNAANYSQHVEKVAQQAVAATAESPTTPVEEPQLAASQEAIARALVADLHKEMQK